MEAQHAELRRKQVAARVAVAVLAVLISIGLWQMYGAWLLSPGEYGS